MTFPRIMPCWAWAGETAKIIIATAIWSIARISSLLVSYSTSSRLKTSKIKGNCQATSNL